jgi:Tfp pilus assembly protein PilX
MQFKSTHMTLSACKQRGVVLFLALIALVVMSLAAVALIRSVDTNTLIAGNLAFRQSATSAGDAGIEDAIARLKTVRNANVAKNPITDATHPFNITDTSAAPGYFSNAGTLNLTAAATWDGVNNRALASDANGNTVQYIVERMCRVANTKIQDADCLFSASSKDNSGSNIKLAKEVCDGPTCPSGGQTPQIRITVRVLGPRNTVSYVQAFVY